MKGKHDQRLKSKHNQRLRASNNEGLRVNPIKGLRANIIERASVIKGKRGHTAVSSGHEYKSGHFSMESNYMCSIFFANTISIDI